jgi:hypothetical protein
VYSPIVEPQAMLLWSTVMTLILNTSVDTAAVPYAAGGSMTQVGVVVVARVEIGNRRRITL